MRGVLVLGQEIEIRPGVTVRDDANNSQVFPTKSKIMSLKSDKNDLQVNHFQLRPLIWISTPFLEVLSLLEQSAIHSCVDRIAWSVKFWVLLARFLLFSDRLRSELIYFLDSWVLLPMKTRRRYFRINYIFLIHWFYRNRRSSRLKRMKILCWTLVPWVVEVESSTWKEEALDWCSSSPCARVRAKRSPFRDVSTEHGVWSVGVTSRRVSRANLVESRMKIINYGYWTWVLLLSNFFDRNLVSECYRVGNLLFCHILYCISSTLGTTDSFPRFSGTQMNYLSESVHLGTKNSRLIIILFNVPISKSSCVYY